MKDLIERINELARKAKTQGLNSEEKLEQNKLRQEYLKRFRGNFKKTLMNVTVVDDKGKDITPEKLRLDQRKNNKN